MARRRKPLILSSTKSLVNSILLNSSSNNQQQQTTTTQINNSDGDDSPTVLQLRAGILRLSEKDNLVISLDHAALIGLSTSFLKKLQITSGSLV